MHRVFITGVGAITPVGNLVKEFWAAVISGVSGLGNITKFDTTNFSVKIAAEVKGFDGGKYFSPKEVRRKDMFVQYAVAAAKEAILDAGIKIENEDLTRIGVIVGSGIGGIETWAREIKVLEQSPRRVSPFFIPMMIINSAAGEISIRHKFKGPNYGTVSACATGAHAIGDAYRLIKYGYADVVVTGGSEAAITPLAVAGFANMKALSTKNEVPHKASKPFDLERDGFVIGEGAGIVILESEEHAVKRDATQKYCEIIGCGMTGDAYHITAPEPSAVEAARAMKLALEEGSCNPEEVDYINAHGTSTPLNDKIETQAIKIAFGEYAYKLPISSTKSMIGHLLGASGAVELIATCLSIKEGIIHPTINIEHPDPDCDLNYTPQIAKKVDIRVAVSNSFGFGGHNISIAIRKI
ncbi:MAG: beta-ketoacyl-ACP synthase II [Candidatus Stahlbacteria bacterium]|nr:beta-ketoacyl-ACP synthase II [Candidatus Stahlbacteria bacterium]